MYNNNKILAVIPARGGSKRLPGKNIKLLGDKPLIAWTIEAAHSSQFIDRVILSSDDKEIISTAKKYGCEVPFVRPSQLASDEASSEDMLEHAIKTLDEKFDYIVLLQPTSPFRTAEDIENCIKLCIDKAVPSVESVTAISENPSWMYYVSEEGMIKRVCQTSVDSQKIFLLNGSVYVIKCDSFLKTFQLETIRTLAYVMPKERSVDIDTAEDFEYAAYLVKKNKLGEISCLKS